MFIILNNNNIMWSFQLVPETDIFSVILQLKLW